MTPLLWLAAAPPQRHIPTLTPPFPCAAVPLCRCAALAETAEFVDLPDALTCPICLCALRNAKETRCGHFFCEACILDSLQRAASCPSCRAPVTAEDLPPFASKSVERAVLDLEVWCAHKASGCAWQGSLRQLPAHTLACG